PRDRFAARLEEDFENPLFAAAEPVEPIPLELGARRERLVVTAERVDAGFGRGYTPVAIRRDVALAAQPLDVRVARAPLVAGEHRELFALGAIRILRDGDEQRFFAFAQRPVGIRR